MPFAVSLLLTSFQIDKHRYHTVVSSGSFSKQSLIRPVSIVTTSSLEKLGIDCFAGRCPFSSHINVSNIKDFMSMLCTMCRRMLLCV